MTKENLKQDLDADDKKIENGNMDPPEKDSLYPSGVMQVFDILFKDKDFPRPKGKVSPTFSSEEVEILANYLFFKPKNIVIRVYERVPKEKGLPFKRQLFIKYFLGDTRFNGAKAARLAGYSVRSAKQIAYKLKRS